MYNSEFRAWWIKCPQIVTVVTVMAVWLTHWPRSQRLELQVLAGSSVTRLLCSWVSVL